MGICEFFLMWFNKRDDLCKSIVKKNVCLLNNFELSYNVVCSPTGLLGPLNPILRLGAGLRFLFEKLCKRQALLHNFAEANCTLTIRTKLMLKPLFFSKIRLKARLLPKPSQPSKNTQISCSNSRPILYYVCQSKFMSLSIHLMVWPY